MSYGFCLHHNTPELLLVISIIRAEQYKSCRYRTLKTKRCRQIRHLSCGSGRIYPQHIVQVTSRGEGIVDEMEKSALNGGEIMNQYTMSETALFYLRNECVLTIRAAQVVT